MATRFGKLPFNDSPRTLVFRCIDDILRADANLQRSLSRVGSFRSWRGGPEDKSDFAQTQAPAVRITPVPAPESWWYPGSTKGDLVVKIELLAGGLCVDDVENLFWALQRALVPTGQAEALAIHKKLVDAGAMTGLILFEQPATDPDPGAGSDGQFRAFGQLKIEVKTS
jgi:hypothetical protein